MSQKELHDLLLELEQERKQFDIVDDEKRHRLDELVEALEQQKLYPDKFDHYSALGDQLQEQVLEFESQHPALARVLESMAELLRNFRP